MQPTIIKIGIKPEFAGEQAEYPGWIVPDTDGLFAVDERSPADLFSAASWVVTHLPTGYAVRKGLYTEATTRDRAVQIAQTFFQEAKKRGWPITSTDMAAIVGPHNAMTYDQKLAFWEMLAGWPTRQNKSQDKAAAT